MRIAFILILLLLIISCNQKESKVSCSKDGASGKKFEMYEMSEMSALMEQMYVDNQKLKERLKRGDTIGKFPSHFLKIHEAVMSDDKENDAFFKQQAAIFINSQKLIYEDPKNAKEHFNNGVSACLNCHEVKCAGPIPRIKKLYIK